MKHVSTWECPECGITKDGSSPHVPDVDTGVYHCNHFIQHGWRENEMEVKEYEESLE